MSATHNLPDLRRKLKNARARALYASGNPSFTGKRASALSCRNNERYEIAQCDIKSLCGLIEGITGKRPKQSDPRRAFQKSFHAIMNKGIK